jgi:DNA modification methylase
VAQGCDEGVELTMTEAPLFEVHVGDAVSVLKTLPEKSVHCCVTSPPYYGLRDYGIPNQIGLEDTPEAFVANLVRVFDEVKRILREDGTLWVVIGDSYYTNWGSIRGKSGLGQSDANRLRRKDGTAKAKTLIGIPWRLAFALQDTGWCLRQEIIWAKGISGPVYRGGGGMPEPVQDRCTRSHETIFLLSKKPRYHFNHEAIQEPAKNWSSGGPGVGIKKTTHYGEQSGGNAGLASLAQKYKEGDSPSTRNMRSVWHVNPTSFKGAHFATFPPALIKPMVLFGCPEDGTVLDPFCGSGTTGFVALQTWRRFVGVELNPDYAEIARERIKSGVIPYEKLF